MQKALLSPQDTDRTGTVALGFSGVPALAPFRDWDYYYLKEPFSWFQSKESTLKNKYPSITVPKGFATDLASIPRVFWPILPAAARYTAPAIIHDYLYWMQNCERKDADAIFLESMKELKVPWWKYQMIHKAVRIGGGAAWRGNAKKRNQGEKRILLKFPNAVEISWNSWKKNTEFFSA